MKSRSTPILLLLTAAAVGPAFPESALVAAAVSRTPDLHAPRSPVGPLPAGIASSDPSRVAKSLLEAMGHAAALVRDYTMTLVKQEWDGDALGSEETILSKWSRPNSIYFKRLSPPHLGREILFVDGWNSDRMRVSLGTFPNLHFNLDPLGKLAMSGCRHPVVETSLVSLVDLVSKNVDTAVARNEATIRNLGEEPLYDRPCTHVQIASNAAGGSTYTIGPGETLWDVARKSGQSMASILHSNRRRGWETPGDAGPGSSVFVPRYYAGRIDLWIDDELRLPLRAMIYDSDGVLFERFEHHDLKVNVGLTARDFSTSNPDYRF